MKANGFTLIEVMIVVALIGILAAIAAPQYTEHMRRAAVTDATSALSDAKYRLEQFYQDNRTYASGDKCGYVPANSDKFNFSCATKNSGQGFQLKATGNAGNTTGFTFTLDETGCKGTTGIPTAWGTLPGNADCDTRENGDNPRWISRKGS